MQFVKLAKRVCTVGLLLVGMTATLYAQQGLEVVLPNGHEQMNAMSLSADGALLATCGIESTAKLWDVASGMKLRDFIGHRDAIYAIALSPDGKFLLTCSHDTTAILWNVVTGARLHTIELAGRILRAEFSRDSSSFLIVGDPSLLRETPSAKVIWRTSAFKDATIADDGKSIVERHKIEDTFPDEVHADKVYLKWEGYGGRLKDRESQKVVMAFEPYTDHRDRWENFSNRVRVPMVHSGDVTPDGKTVVTGARGTVFVWDVATQSRRRVIPSPVSPVVGLDLRDGLLAIGTAPLMERAQVWDLSTGGMIRSVTGSEIYFGPKAESLFAVAGDWNSDEYNLLGRRSWSLNQWQIRSGIKEAELKLSSGKVETLIQGNGTKLFVRSTDRFLESFRGPIDVIDVGSRSVSTLKGRFTFYPGRENEEFSMVSNNGQWALSEELESGQLNAVLWNLTSRSEIRRVSLNITVGSLEFTGVPHIRAIAPDGGTLLVVSHDQSVSKLSSARDRVASTNSLNESAAFVSIWDLKTGKLLREIRCPAGFVSYCDYNSDGKRFVTGGADGTVVLWETQTGRQVQKFRGHEGYTNKAVFSQEGSQMWTTSTDGTARLWDVASGKELCKLMMFKENDWLVVTPEGLFDGSVDGPRYLAYRVPGTLEFVPLERYQQKFYQPGLLASLTRGTRLTPKVDITKSIPPKVRITSPTSAADLKQSTVEVHAEAETRGEHPIKSLRLLVDGRPFGGQHGIHKVADPKLGSVSASWNIELDPGRHTLKVLADTEYVQGASDELEVRYVGGDTGGPSDLASVELPSLYVLSIGISKYPGTRKLDYAAADAEAIAKSFDQHSRALFKNMEVKAVLDEQADRKGFFAGMQWLREKMTQKSVGVVFFAGHGEKDKDGTLYFLPVDFEENNLAGSAIDADVLKRQLMGIPGRLTLMLDACHSGEIGSGKTRGVGSLTDQLIRDLTAEENGLVMMCSALGNELAQESNEHRHGLFTVALLEGLKGQAEKTKDGAIYLTSLDAYVTKRVRELSKGQQNPVTGKPTSVRDFPMSRP